MTTPVDTTHERPEPEPPRTPPPATRPSAVEWVRDNLFNSWYNALLTLVLGPLIVWVAYRLLWFVVVTGRWDIVERNLTSFMVGRFPRDQLWRVWTSLFVLTLTVGLGAGVTARAAATVAAIRGLPTSQPWQQTLRRAAPLLALVGIMVVFVRTATPIVLLAGVAAVGLAAFFVGRRLPPRARRWVNLAVLAGLAATFYALTGADGVRPRFWGGFMLNAYFTVAGIALSFPLGVALALGRRSSLPAVRGVCVGYIELIRGVPLVALLFMGWLILGFFLPRGTPVPDIVQRALIIFIMFTGAYVAEIVRGGLQSIPKGQTEAAVALGLSPWKVTRLVVLPQALRNVIPAMVGQFISLYKDTSLVFVIGLLEILTVARRVTQQPAFLGQGLHTETLLFVAFIFWVGSYWMSRESQRLERRLGVGQR